MKKLATLLISVLLIVTMQANAQHLEEIYSNTIQFDKACTGAPTNYFAKQIDVSKYWHPALNIGTSPTGTDSTWVLDLISSVYNGADSGDVLTSIGLSNLNVTVTAGFAGKQLDSILVPTDSCCYDSTQSVLRYVTALSAASNPILCAAADTAVLNAALTTDRTVTIAAKRLTSLTPSKYLYILYRDVAGNSHYNVFRHRVSAVKYPE